MRVGVFAYPTSGINFAYFITMRQSAGLLLYRIERQSLLVLLVHPGGPFWARKDAGSWTIPKGEPGPDEDLLEAARREFAEETGCSLTAPAQRLEPVKQKGGKIVYAWAVEGDFDPGTLQSNTFEMEWPPRSGQFRQFPEVDQAAWFTPEEARAKILPAQVPFIDQLVALLDQSA